MTNSILEDWIDTMSIALTEFAQVERRQVLDEHYKPLSAEELDAEFQRFLGERK